MPQMMSSPLPPSMRSRPLLPMMISLSEPPV